MTLKKRKRKPQVDRRERPHLLRDEWNLFTFDPRKREKLEEALERGLGVFEAAVAAGYSDRHARRLEWGV